MEHTHVTVPNAGNVLSVLDAYISRSIVWVLTAARPRQNQRLMVEFETGQVLTLLLMQLSDKHCACHMNMIFFLAELKVELIMEL